MLAAPTRTLVLNLRSNEHFKRLEDPYNSSLYLGEALLPFSEAAKLERGNANVRPPSDRKPTRDMFESAEQTPVTFHLKNRGIVYLCQRFQFENASRRLTVTIPKVVMTDEDVADEGVRFGIADGGHTHDVVQRTVERFDEYAKFEDWSEPFVRVHFMASEQSLEDEIELEKVVEALNTSLQVKQYTLDEYKNEFHDLKEALERQGFPIDVIAFRENEDDKEWNVTEIVQRLACFLKERWKVTQPANMYKSKNQALRLFKGEDSRDEFRKLYDVVKDVVTFPEFIQSELSAGKVGPLKSFAKLKSVKQLSKPETKPGTSYLTSYKVDMATLLPMAAAFRELLALKGDRYYWKVDPWEAFRRAAPQLYDVLLQRIRKVRTPSHLASDMEYWSACVTIVMRVMQEMLEERVTGTPAA
jgi:AIPR protein